jgi:hypothetical protein
MILKLLIVAFLSLTCITPSSRVLCEKLPMLPGQMHTGSIEFFRLVSVDEDGSEQTLEEKLDRC